MVVLFLRSSQCIGKVLPVRYFPVFTPIPLRFPLAIMFLLPTFWAVIGHSSGIMDADNSAATLLAGKIHRCPCERWMSSVQRDFHSLCVVCQGVDCGTDNQCPECADVDDLQMTNSVKHKPSLQRKLQSKHKLKEMISSPAVAVNATDVAASDHPSSPIPVCDI